MLTKKDLVKYPYTAEAAEYVKSLGIGIKDLESADYMQIVERAERRIEEAIEKAALPKDWLNDDVEILSYPTAIMILSSINDERVSRRYALSEGKRAYELLRAESNEKVAELAVNTFSWRIKQTNIRVGENYYDYGLHLKDYLRNAISIRADRWKLVNRVVAGGFVHVTKDEASRLLEEEVQRRVLERIGTAKAEPQVWLKPRIERIRQLATARIGVISTEEMPRFVVAAAMPPCIRSLYDSLFAGRHIPHIGRFSLTSFLVNIGLSEEDVIKIFKSATDFDERMTRYQVEHIAGRRGTKTKYTPPKCSTLRTHSLCVAPDELCRRIQHPLTYYRRKVKLLFGGRARTKG